jgi:hypothetical protein
MRFSRWLGISSSASTCAVLVYAMLGHARSAEAQVQGTGTWLWDVTTQDGDNIVHPGETATITLSLDLSPNVGEPGQTGGAVKGLAVVIFDTLGGLNADNGTVVGWDINSSLTFLLGDFTTSDGISLFGTVAGQICCEAFDSSDPIRVITFEWMPAKRAQYDVAYSTATDPGSFFVWEFGDPGGTHWPHVIEASIRFQVVPAPSGILILVTVAIACGRQRSVGLPKAAS